MNPRPEACRSCTLDDKASGFAPPEGPENAPLLWLGEALGGTEAAVGRPFVGDAGGMLQRLLNLLGWERGAQRIANVIQCRPPNDWMDGTPQAPWFHSAIEHCRVHRDPVFAEGHKVTIALGGTALKTSLGLLHRKKIRVQDFHGTITRDPTDRFWVVPTFHPSHLQRGAHNLIGTVLWDLQQAQYASVHGKPEDNASLIVDPPLEWFRQWVDQVIAARQQDPTAYPISSDIETPDKAGGKDEGEITVEDRSYTILRVNVACHPDEGVTVPFAGPFIDELTRLHQSPGMIWGWNYTGYDFDRAVAAGFLKPEDFQRVLDLMWLAHHLQSDLPRGLGFWAPFYSNFGPWKHLAETDPATYGAGDGLQNHRVGFGVLKDLQKLGMYEHAMRHIHRLHWAVLRPAQLVGVKINRERLVIFKEELTEKATRLLGTLQDCYPEDLRPLTPEGGLTSPPADNVLHVKATAFTRKGAPRAGKAVPEIKLDLYKKAVVLERQVQKDILVCKICGEKEIQRRHRCQKPYQKKDGTTGWKPADYEPDIQIETALVTRWFWQEPFNPDSWQQVLAYMKFRKHTPGRAKKTHKESTNRETLERLQRTGDRFYSALLDYRAVNKVKGTYVDGTERRMDDQDRIHPEPTFKPSTGRLSYQNPNITNVISDRGGKQSLAAGFRNCIVASPGCRLLEIDFAGSEAVDVGWFSRDPNYIRLAKLGVHAGLASHILDRPYDPKWSDEDLGLYFKEIKNSHLTEVSTVYKRSKAFVHAYSYGLTLMGMLLQFPDIFPNIKTAEKYADLFDSMAPAVEPWQKSVRERAFKQHYLGGPGDHPFGNKHWFWSVFTYKKITPTQYYKILQQWKLKGKSEADAPVSIINGQYFKISLGEDGKRSVAFYPQSTTGEKLKTVMMRLLDPESPSYIGAAYYDLTPLRAPVHDSLLFEFPIPVFDWAASLALIEMHKPFREMPCPAEWGLGPYLSTGISAKTGLDWGSMEDLDVKDFVELGVGTDTILTAAEEEEAEDVADFGREVA